MFKEESHSVKVKEKEYQKKVSLLDQDHTVFFLILYIELLLKKL